MCAAPNNFGSNLTKSIVVMPINSDGTPVSSDNPAQVELYVDGAPVSASNPVPVSGGGGGGSGTVTSVSVVTANGVSGSVATATTTPAITLTLGAITPTSVNGNTITAGTGTLTLGSTTLVAADVPTSASVIADNALVAGDGGARGIQGRAITVSDVSGNIVTLSSTAGNALTIATADTNKNIVVAPHGTGNTIISSAKSSIGDTIQLDGSWVSGVTVGASGQNKFLIGYASAFLGGTACLAGANSALSAFADVSIIGTNVRFSTGSSNASEGLRVTSTGVNPGTNDNFFPLGTSAFRWAQLNLGPTGTVIGGSATPAASPGTVNSSARQTKYVTAIADNTPTAVLTVTIPNAAHSGCLRITLLGTLGAGGAIGANEASASITYDIAIARTAGANAVAVASTAYGSAVAAVAGGGTMTVAAAVSAISGAVGASNTFTVNVTIDDTTGSATNHRCQISYELINVNATGITCV